MFRSLYLGRPFGIDTYIHWSFWLMLIWVVLSQTMEGGLHQGIFAIAIVITIFACVYLHELGHALAAAHYQIKTRNITLLPFGGVAQLEQMPPGLGEVFVALAGPAVNLAIAIILWCILLVTGDSEAIRNFDLDGMIELKIMQQLFLLNVGLALFNLLPAFPLDGGRVLRGLLTARVGDLRATQYAAKIGRYLAFAMIVFGLFYSWSLALIGVFIVIEGYIEIFNAYVRDQRERSPMPEVSSEYDPENIIDADDVRRL